jgi:hypothetical protein
VKTDKVKVTRYVVTVYPPLKQKPVIIEPSQGIVKTEPEKDETILLTDEESLSEDSMIIVMSDASDVTFDIEMDEELDNKAIDWAIDKIVLEEELFTRSSSDVSNAEYALISSHVNWQLSEQWDIQLAARIDAYHQHGKNGTDADDVNLDYEDSYIRYRDDHFRVTVGTQTIRWGRVDILAPTDNMVTLDLSRGILPNWDDLY